MFKHGFPPEWSTFKKLIWLVGSGIAGASAIWKTVTGALIHITDALASPVKELSVAIEPLQSGSGDPSPDNVRPITGWTGANIYVSGADTSNPTTYPISWQTEAGTVYGGTLDVVNGTLTVTFGIVHAKDLTWTRSSNLQGNPNGTYYESTNDPPFLGWSDSVKAKAISNALVASNTGARTTSAVNTFWWNSSSKDYRIVWGLPSGGSTLTELNSFLSENDVVFVAELKTPLSYTLTPQQISTLAGENNIWTDVNGEITLTYQAVPQTAFSDETDKGMADYMTLTE